jgi:hypothetical protein
MSLPTLPCLPLRRNACSRLRVVVLGYVIRGPIGGMAWHHLQYVLGLHRLGYDVLFLEESDEYPSCYDPSTHQVGTDPTYGLCFAQNAFTRLNLGDKWAYYDRHTQRWFGPAANEAISFCQEADVLLNVSGVNPLRSWHDEIPFRVMIDTDPVFTQVRNLVNAAARRRTSQHNSWFSFGELIGTGKNTLPDDGFPWLPTRQPLVLDAWPQMEPRGSTAYTTVMQWDSYPPVQFHERRFGMKSDSFEIVRELPRQSVAPLEIALGGSHAPRRELEHIGWRVVDPLAISRDPWTYQNYLQHSRGELSVAKHGYVAGRCGWFSERTACYLASGRPAIVQDTGFSSLFPCGRGIWAFDDADSALVGITEVESNYRAHCRAAREFAAEYFDSRRVLDFLLERASNLRAADGDCKSTDTERPSYDRSIQG